jgi:hypothetical protein
MSIRVNLSAKKDLGISMLQRKNPDISALLAEASLVSVFRLFKKQLQDRITMKHWADECVSGPLFVVMFKSYVYSICVLNQEGGS